MLGAVGATQIRTFELVVGTGTALLLIGYGAFLVAVSRGVWRGRRWSRGPAVATQLLHVPIAWSLNGGGAAWVTWPLILVSVLTLVCLVLPASTAVFLEDAPLENPPLENPPPETRTTELPPG